MLLISENHFENQLIPGLVSILRDLQVDAQGFAREEAIAPLFWSSEDFLLELSSINNLSKDEITAILTNLETALLEAMMLAGFEVIMDYWKELNGTVVYPRHRMKH